MGSDDLFHKRKARNNKTLRRKSSNKELYTRALIVCEGKKTEPGYLKALIDDLALLPQRVNIDHNGSSPKSILKHAKQHGNDFENIFLVFDKDKHDCYQQVLDAISRNKHLTAINSVPCFEYWILLHFEYTDGPHTKADSVISKLKKHLPHYSKNNFYTEIQQHTDRAIKNADKANNAADATRTDNPSTRMPVLVKHLRKMRQEQAD